MRCEPHPPLLALQGLDVHWAEQANPHHPGDAARIVAVGLVYLRCKHRTYVPSLDAYDRQASLRQFTVE
jgi:hypothetical protein